MANTIWLFVFISPKDLSAFRPVYAPKDFLDMLIMLKNPNSVVGSQSALLQSWGLIQLPLEVKDINILVSLKVASFLVQTSSHYCWILDFYVEV